jgi:hypothetical protein
MRSSTILHFWEAAGVLAVIACWALYKFAASLRRDRLLEDTPLVKIRSAAQGYVKVYGHAKPTDADAAVAPLSSRPCVWWSYEIEEKYRNAKGETSWRTINSASSVTPFLLADADGECLVGPVNAEITPTSRDVWYGDSPSPARGPVASGGYFGSEDYRYTERLLRVDDQLTVTGELRSDSEIRTGDAEAAALLRQWKADQPALVARFDQNHDGKIDAAEWETARLSAAREAQGRALGANIVRTSCIGEPTHGEPFLIAPMDSQHLVRREKWLAAMFFAIGVLSAGFSAWAAEHARTLTSL